jgi:hypothetical protein
MEGGRESRTGQRVRLVGSLQKAHTVSRVVGARLGVVMVAEMAHRSNGLEGGNWLFLLLVAECWELLEAGEKRWMGQSIRLGRPDLDLNVWESMFRIASLSP